MKRRLVIIDGKSVFYRGYYAMPGLSLRDGTPTGGVYGFASLALEVIKKLEPDYVAVAWDKSGTSIRQRLKILPTYKAGRKKPPEDFFAQIPILKELLEGFRWPLYELDDYEADDIMGGLAEQASAQDIETCLITSDLDMLQLISPLVHVYALKKGFTEIEQFSPAYFEQKYGIGVHQFLDLKSLKGDNSDNIPGVPGIGEKTAVQLLQEFGTLDGIYANIDKIKPSVAKKLEDGKDSAYLSKKVARIWVDAPISLNLDEMDAHDLDSSKLAELLKRLEFNSLVRRLPQHMRTSDTSQGSLFDLQTQSTAPKLEEVDWPEDILGDVAIVHYKGEDVWISSNESSFSRATFSDISTQQWNSLMQKRVAAYDLKELYHAAHREDIELYFKDAHDLRQGAFLLDPIMRDRSVSGLVDTDVDETDAAQIMAALWSIYKGQRDAFDKFPKIANIAYKLDFPLAHTLFRMETHGILLNKKLLNEMSNELEEEHKELEQQMFAMVGYEFNIGSPAQLSEVLFTKLQLSTAGIKKGKTGYSTGQKELDKLRGQHPIVELIERTRELAKLKNTYVDTLPEQADEMGRIHTTFNQDVASTGRLSSTNPNLQNIPVRSELGRRIREAFIPAAGSVFVSADYSQFELRLAAVLANDEALIDDFNNGADIHTKTASEAYGIPMEQVTKNQRRAAKVINFGVLYGMSPHGLSAATGMSFTEAKNFIDQYFQLRAPVRSFIDATLQKAKDEGYVETYLGRRRPTPDVSSSNFMVREAAKRAAANMPIQGTEADLMKLAMLEVDERLGDLGYQVLQIHDSILIECPEQNADTVAELLRTTMENVYPDLRVKLKVDVAIGNNWGDL